MKAREEKYFQDEFVARWAARDLSANEQMEFDEWLKSKPQYTEYFNSLENIWKDSENIQISGLYDEEQRWNKLRPHLVSKRQRHSFLNRNLTKWVSGMAAIFLVMLLYSTFFKSDMVTITSPYGTHLTHTLPDGSSVILNAGSSIRYRRKNWSNRRLLSLTGEAYFKVTHGKTFTVRTQTVETTVLGTVFNIRENSTRILVSCIEGKVRVKNTTNSGSTILKSCQEAEVIPDSTGINVHPFDPVTRTTWISGFFNFNNAPLMEVFDEIEKQYDVSIACPTEFEGLHFTGQFSNKDLNDALLVVCLANGLKFHTTGDSSITIYK